MEANMWSEVVKDVEAFSWKSLVSFWFFMIKKCLPGVNFQKNVKFIKSEKKGVYLGAEVKRFLFYLKKKCNENL